MQSDKVNMDEMIEQVAPTNVSLDDLEDLINSLSPDEVAELAECDPDVSPDDGQECFLLSRLLMFRTPRCPPT